MKYSQIYFFYRKRNGFYSLIITEDDNLRIVNKIN